MGYTVNIELESSCARPELVEGYLRALERYPSTSSGRARRKNSLISESF